MEVYFKRKEFLSLDNKGYINREGFEKNNHSQMKADIGQGRSHLELYVL
jgi:hypothetical protein